MKIRILGIRGVPASHGGFETFAEYLSLYLKHRGWDVVVYCQESGPGEKYVDVWEGVERIHIPVEKQGPVSTIIFDWKSVVDAARSKDLCLTLGYNTAVFSSLLRVRGVKNIINMDGIEWSRAKWGKVAKVWFWINDWMGCWLGDHLVADHPEIKKHLSTRVNGRKITTIGYGAERVSSSSDAPLSTWGLAPGRFLTVIARGEPENSILEIVKGFSRVRRNFKLVVLGTYDRTHPYQSSVLSAASDEVIFPGAIYDKNIVKALRFHSALYVHGHQVGGTNPSLVEALGAGNAVVAHDNRFNRWVAGSGACYFQDEESFSTLLDRLLQDDAKLEMMRKSSIERFEESFTWTKILEEYERLLSSFA
jgi:glycosyltransferase involved in cell wall biosynthesis